MNIEDIKAVYFVGAGGIGMSAIARYFLKKGLHDVCEFILIWILILMRSHADRQPPPHGCLWLAPVTVSTLPGLFRHLAPSARVSNPSRVS